MYGAEAERCQFTQTKSKEGAASRGWKQDEAHSQWWDIGTKRVKDDSSCTLIGTCSYRKKSQVTGMG